MEHEKSSFSYSILYSEGNIVQFSLTKAAGGYMSHPLAFRTSLPSSSEGVTKKKTPLPNGRGQDEGGRRKNPIFCRYHPHPGLPRRCEEINSPPPPCPSPVKGEGISLWISIIFPPPLAGEGRVRGNISIFSQLAPARGRGSRKPS